MNRDRKVAACSEMYNERIICNYQSPHQKESVYSTLTIKTQYSHMAGLKMDIQHNGDYLIMTPQYWGRIIQ